MYSCLMERHFTATECHFNSLAIWGSCSVTYCL